MEDPVVGGVPCFTWVIQRHLPKNKKKREFVYQIQMVIFTYVIYSLFNMARRPIAIVKSKIIEECNQTTTGENLENETWCKEEHYFENAEEILGLMDFLYTLSYGLCLYASGVVADCYNPRFYLTAGCFVSGYFCAILGLADYWNIRSFEFLGTVLILLGASQSTAWPVVLSSVTHWYGVIGKRRGMFFGFWNTHNYLGSMLGILLAGIWVDSKWQWSFFVPGFILALAGVWVLLYMVVDPKDLKELDKGSTQALGRRPSHQEIPDWLNSKSSITMYEAWTLPGVIEFSTCMFFSRMVGYIFLFWLPVFMHKVKRDTATRVAYYSLAYVVGGSCGGILAGIFVDVTRHRALVCAFFLVLSIPVLLLGLLSEIGQSLNADFPLIVLMGLFVEAPYVVISTSISADLGTHKMVKRNYRALSTVGGIIEGTGAIGASIGTYISGIMLANTEWTAILYMMIGCQFLALVCLFRQAYKDFYRKPKKEPISDYMKLPSFF